MDRQKLIGIAIMAITTLFGIALLIFDPIKLILNSPNIQGYGLFAAFIIMAISSATIFIPVPGWFGLFFLAHYIDPFTLGIAGGIGSALGELTSYVFGHGGKMLIEEKNIGLYIRLKEWLHKHGVLIIFLFAALPLPVDLVGIAAGSTGYPLWKFLLAMIPGKIIKTWMVTFLGAAALGWFT